MTTTPFPPTAGASTTPSASAPTHAAPRRRVIDAPTRMFHWLFALSFLGAYVTADGERWRALHVTLGYTLAGLLAFRVLYGLFGPRPARLGVLWRKLGGAPAWLRATASSLRQGQWRAVNGRQGQNLLMATAVMALLVLALPLTLSGYGAWQEWGEALFGDALAELHEGLGEAYLAVVLAHLGLIAALSLLRRRNQALPMLTGRVEGPGPDLVQRNHAGLAALLLVAVLGFWAWQWQQSPQGLLPATTAGASASHHEDDDD